jgi:hypothetical protein
MGSDCSLPPGSSDYGGLGFEGLLAYTFGANRPKFRGGFTIELALHWLRESS